MKKIHVFFTGALFLFLTGSATASHLIGGYIIAQKLTGRTYDVSLVLYSDPNGAADPGTVSAELSFGDGAKQEATRISSQSESARVRKNTYAIRHEYASDGSFAISFRDINLVNGIVNINNGRSDATELYLETKINVNTTWDDQFTPRPLAFEDCNTAKKQSYILSYNPAFADRDGDSISYHLITPSDLTKQGYEIPEGMHINAYSGTISWPLSEIYTGRYLLYYKVNSYNAGTLITSSIIAQPFMANINAITFPSNIEAMGSDLAPAGWLRRMVQPGDLFSQGFSSNMQEGAFKFSLACYSGLFFKNADSSSIRNNEYNKIVLNWQTSGADASNLPYFVIYRQRNASTNQIHDHVLGVYVGAPLTSGVYDLSKSQIKSEVYPNPVKKSCRFSFDLSGEVDLSVYDITGRQVFRESVRNGYEWSRGNIPAGIYSFTLQSPDGLIHRGKLILE